MFNFTILWIMISFPAASDTSFCNAIWGRPDNSIISYQQKVGLIINHNKYEQNLINLFFPFFLIPASYKSNLSNHIGKNLN